METAGRVERWSQKLLDISLSNRLLNLKDSKKVIPLACPDIVALEDKIAANEAFTIQSGEFSADTEGKLVQEMSERRLWTRLTSTEVQRRLKELYRLAKVDLEESGVNTLFLAVGFLEWKPEEAPQRTCRAPILLIPVRLVRGNIADGIKLVRLDDDTVANTTLLELLRTQFSIIVRDINPLPTDTSGVDVTRVLERFREAIASRKDWAIVEEAAVGQFSFGKFVMWKDMTSRMDDFCKNPLVAHLVSGGGKYDDGVEVFPAADIAKHIDYSSLCCPLSADSSQLTAVLYSAMGKTFVLHGPPGTGKSQTITNLIAHNLSLGRKVLFVSEKKAALDVVHRRLSSIGLEPFCLELHSNKSGKAEVLAQFAAALKVAQSTKPAQWKSVIGRLEGLRGELEGYVEALHHVYPNGKTAYKCFGRLMESGNAVQAGSHSNLVNIDCLEQTKERYEALEQEIETLAEAAGSISKQALASLEAVKEFSWAPQREQELSETIAKAREAFDAYDGDVSALVNRLGGILVGVLVKDNSSPAAFLDRFARAKGKYEACCKALESFRLDEISALDIKGLESRMRENDEKFLLLRYFGSRAIAKGLRGIKKPGGGALTFKELVLHLDDFAEYQKADEEYKEARTRAVQDVADLRKVLDGITENLGELRRAFAYRAARRTVAASAGKLVKAMEDGEFGCDRLLDEFRLAYASRMINQIFAKDQALAGFSFGAHEARIRRFQEVDREWAKLSGKMAVARIAEHLLEQVNSSATKPARTSPLGILRHECEKKMRHKPVRQLLSEIGSLATALKPCFLMSPLSVAQYLPADTHEFDLVVFDEASQIPVWDSIGVIARAPQVVVVGDPKQMPPTNFFQKGEVADDDECSAGIEDLESILDECLAAGVFSSYLSWHYRSRHESLIAFSNHNYYGDSLMTFPAASNSPLLGVRFKFVEGGVYDRKATRTNALEAKALVDYIFETLKDPAARKRTMGVVTFSEAQKNLIEDLIDQRREKEQAYEEYFTSNPDESFFVKNLENVQGDERDVILFSVCYAPDATGKFAMNFGPLNKSGGERRLNVAVTRAKEQIVLFSSIHGHQIDLDRTSSVGAAQLRDFIEFAEKGTFTMATVGAGTTARDGLADVVADFLTARGYKINRAVGRSNCKIDIAVRDPEAPERYLAGIICDGATYSRPATARDRDAQIPSVFASLGWNLIHAWSVDWAFDRARAEKALLEALKTPAKKS